MGQPMTIIREFFEKYPPPFEMNGKWTIDAVGEKYGEVIELMDDRDGPSILAILNQWPAVEGLVEVADKAATALVSAESEELKQLGNDLCAAASLFQDDCAGSDGQESICKDVVQR